jgi:hypothetical protein
LERTLHIVDNLALAFPPTLRVHIGASALDHGKALHPEHLIR